MRPNATWALWPIAITGAPGAVIPRTSRPGPWSSCSYSSSGAAKPSSGPLNSKAWWVRRFPIATIDEPPRWIGDIGLIRPAPSSAAAATTAEDSVGIVPLTVLVAYLGSRLESPDFSDWRVWLLIAGFVAIVVGGQVLERRLRSGGAKNEEAG